MRTTYERENNSPPIFVEGLSEALENRLQPGQNILLCGPPFAGKTTLGMQFIFSGLRVGEKGIIITTNDSAGAMRKKASRFGWDTRGYEKEGQLKFVDCYAKIAGLIQDEAKTESVFRAGQSSGELEKISIYIAATLSDFWRTGSQVRVIIDNISSLFLYSSFLEVMRFLHTVSGRLKAVEATSMLIVEAGMHDEQTMTAVRSICNGVMLLTNEKDRRYLQGFLETGILQRVPLELSKGGLRPVASVPNLPGRSSR